MRLKNILLVVGNIESSKEFYKEYFGLCVVSDYGDNAILTEGLVLQEKSCWEKLIGANSVVGNASELFFVEENLDAFVNKIEKYMSDNNQEINVRENSWGKSVIMLKDPDGHLIEVAEK